MLPEIERRGLTTKLLANLKTAMPKLEELQQEVVREWCEEDGIYRFYHHSFKVFGRLQPVTCEIFEAFKQLLPDHRINHEFALIINEGLSKHFDMAVTNANWLRECRPVLEAFFHAKYFLEQAIKYGKSLEEADLQNVLPSGWAAFLYLFDLR